MLIGRAQNTLAKLRCIGGVADPALPLHGIADPRRLAAVARTGLLDTPPDPAFDDLTRLAAILVSAPLAFATIVDDRRSFWKSTFGVPGDAPRENTVEESFCQYVVRPDAPEPVGRRNGCPRVAGFPLLAPDGEVLGSFCVVDTKPREWTARDLEVLRTLSGAASREIALRAAIENERRARLHAEAVTRTLQASLLPPACRRSAASTSPRVFGRPEPAPNWSAISTICSRSARSVGVHGRRHLRQGPRSGQSRVARAAHRRRGGDAA